MKVLDLLFSKYASPFIFIDTMIQLGKLDEAIRNLLDEQNENRLWDLYLRVLPKKSFNDWKKDLVKNETSELNENEIMAQVEESQNILNSFKPL